MSNKPDFRGFLIVGDKTTWTREGFDFVARIEHDPDTQPGEFESCYTDKQQQAFYADDWSFVGVVVDVYYRGVKLVEHAASLWGIALGLAETDEEDRQHINEVTSDLEPIALAEARETLAKLRAVELLESAHIATSTLDRMKNIGGSFAARLAGLYIVADDGNRARLVKEFKDEFNRFSNEVWEKA